MEERLGLQMVSFNSHACVLNILSSLLDIRLFDVLFNADKGEAFVLVAVHSVDL